MAWTLDMMGQAIRRSEKDNQPDDGDPHEIWHRLSGRQMGYVGHSVNNDVNYAQSVSNRAFGEDASAHADFDLAYNHITTYEQGSMGGAYTARAGDTLQSIAAGMWGDASLWYKIAEANGLSGQSALSEGQSLLIPVGVQRNENNASTFQPYDPLEVLGNTSPTSPKPKEGKQCGVMGQVILAVVTYVVAYYVGPEVANIVQQGLMMATGYQDEFSWNQLAVATVSAGVSAYVGNYTTWGQSAANFVTNNPAAQQFVAGAVNGAASSAISQGIAYAAGWQDKFSWSAVAAAGVSGGVFKLASAYLPGAAHTETRIGPDGPFTVDVPATPGNRFTASGAAMIANAATRSLMNGGDFGDNIMAALPDVIGQTIGEAIAGRIGGHGGASAAVEEEQGSTSAGYEDSPRKGQKIPKEVTDVVRDARKAADATALQDGGPVNDAEGVLLHPEGSDAAGFAELDWDSPAMMFPEEPAPTTDAERAARDARIAERARRLAEEERWYNQIARWGAGAAGELGSWALETGVPEFGVGVGLVDGFLDLLKFRGAAATARLEARAAAELAEELFERTAARIAEDGHAFLRHGEAVTDADLLRRATTGVAPDGTWSVYQHGAKAGQVRIPQLSSAFHSDELLVAAEVHVRQTYLSRAAALVRGGQTRITIEGVDMGQVVGRAYTAATAGSPPTLVSNLTRVTATFQWDFRTASWSTVTIYPSR